MYMYPDFKFLGKNKDAAKVVLTMVVKVCTLYYMYKLVVHVTLPSKHFHKTLSRETTLYKIVWL